MKLFHAQTCTCVVEVDYTLALLMSIRAWILCTYLYTYHLTIL